jgi:ferredoxin
MATVVFEADGCAPATVSAPDGGRLLDLIDKTALHVETSCRSGDCGTCLVTVLQGKTELMPPGAAEIAGLLGLGVVAAMDSTEPKKRLACQAWLRPGSAIVRLRAG